MESEEDQKRVDVRIGKSILQRGPEKRCDKTWAHWRERIGNGSLQEPRSWGRTSSGDSSVIGHRQVLSRRERLSGSTLRRPAVERELRAVPTRIYDVVQIRDKNNSHIRGLPGEDSSTKLLR